MITKNSTSFISKIKQVYHSLRRKLARIWLEINLQLTVIGVTGSYGKTSTVRAIAEVLSEKYSVNKTDLNLDTIYNLPITILKTRIWSEFLVLEYGIDHLGEMEQHLKLVKPKIGVLTGIAPVHIDDEHLRSLENVISEKRKLIDALPPDGWAVFNYDDENVRKIGLSFNGKKYFYGLKKGADIWANKIKISPQGTSFNLHFQGLQTEIFTPLLGYPAVYSCLVAFLVGLNLGVPQDKILKRLFQLKPLPGRFSLEKGPLRTILVNDRLRANLASTIAGLKSFSFFSGRKIAVLGEMGETGKLEELVHRQVGKEIANLKIDCIVGVGPLTKFIIDEAKKSNFPQDSLFWAENTVEAAVLLKKILKPGDYLYLKASLLRHLERILLILEGQKVTCKRTVCHRYFSCNTCPFLAKGIK